MSWANEIPIDVRCEMCEVTYPHLHIRPMEEVLDYESCDAGCYGGDTVRDCLEGKIKDTVQIESLYELFWEEGFRPGYGIAIEYGYNYVHDGHHRIATLYFMGAQWCPVQYQGTHARDTAAYARSKQERYGRRKGSSDFW